MSATELLTGKYHPDPEINEGVTADALEGELANLQAGFPASEWECECGARHRRGPTPSFGWRCLSCGFIGLGGRLLDPTNSEETPNGD